MAAQYPPRYWEGKPAACLRPIHSTNQSPSKCHSYSGRQPEEVSPTTSTRKGRPKGFLKYLHLWQPEYERNPDTYVWRTGTYALLLHVHQMLNNYHLTVTYVPLPISYQLIWWRTLLWVLVRSACSPPSHWEVKCFQDSSCSWVDEGLICQVSQTTSIHPDWRSSEPSRHVWGKTGQETSLFHNKFLFCIYLQQSLFLFMKETVPNAKIQLNFKLFQIASNLWWQQQFASQVPRDALLSKNLQHPHKDAHILLRAIHTELKSKSRSVTKNFLSFRQFPFTLPQCNSL